MTQQTGGVPAPTYLEVRPVRQIVVCRFVAAVALGGCVVAALLLGLIPPGGIEIGVKDQVAFLILGVVLAAGVLWFTRPYVVADASRVMVRNLGGVTEVPWAIVVEVRYDTSTSWAVLRLADDDRVPMMAVQRADGARASAAVAELRAMLAAAHQSPHELGPDPNGPDGSPTLD